jgi:hypothetical protein
MWRGALFAAVGFELLKLIVVNILGHVGGTSFAPLALAVTLLVWINYFSRLVMYGASWAMTAPESVAQRAGAAADAAARSAQFRSSVVAQSATRQIAPTTSDPVSRSGPARTARGNDRVSVAAGAVVGAAATAAAFSASAVRRRLAGTVGRRR